MSIGKKASHLTSERAQSGESRQVFERSQTQSRSKFRLSAALVMLISTCLPALSADWSAFVSKTETIKFIAPVACDAWLWWTPPARYLAAHAINTAQVIARIVSFDYEWASRPLVPVVARPS